MYIYIIYLAWLPYCVYIHYISQLGCPTAYISLSSILLYIYIIYPSHLHVSYIKPNQAQPSPTKPSPFVSHISKTLRLEPFRLQRSLVRLSYAQMTRLADISAHLLVFGWYNADRAANTKNVYMPHISLTLFRLAWLFGLPGFL